MEKIDVLVKVADNGNIDLIMSELKEYCHDIELDFVRKSVKAIGLVATKVERCAKRAVEILEELVQQEGADTALQEAIQVCHDIFRKYPAQFSSLIWGLCSQMKRIYEPTAKASMIWILGEYAEKIDSVEDMLEYFTENINDEPVNVQLSILTAAVKMYLKKPDDCEDLVMRILKISTEESDNPDLRDRGYIYWRMLSTDPASTKFVVLSDKPEYQTDENDGYDEDFLNNLIVNISNLSAVYHITPDDIETP